MVILLIVLDGRVDQVLLLMAPFVIRANFVLILSVGHVHGPFVDAFE